MGCIALGAWASSTEGIIPRPCVHPLVPGYQQHNLSHVAPCALCHAIDAQMDTQPCLTALTYDEPMGVAPCGVPSVPRVRHAARHPLCTRTLLTHHPR